MSLCWTPLQLFMTREPNPGFRSPSASSSGVFSYDLAEGVQSGHHLCESTLGGQAPERSCPTSTSGLGEHRVQGTRPEYKAILKDESWSLGVTTLSRRLMNALLESIT